MLTFVPTGYKNDVSFSIDYGTYDASEGRHLYEFTIEHAGAPGKPKFGPWTVRSGVCDPDNPPRLGTMLASAMGFYSAYLECREYGSPDSENWDLFTVDGDLAAPIPDLATRDELIARFNELTEALSSEQVAGWADEVFASE